MGGGDGAGDGGETARRGRGMEERSQRGEEIKRGEEVREAGGGRSNWSPLCL